MSHKKWKIWVDTGGTFTDCIALSPSDKKYEIKVLSKSALRGKVKKILGPATLEFECNWPLDEDIFAGYIFNPLKKKHISTKIRSIDFKAGIIYLENNILSGSLKGQDFEISAGEQAPVLAARLVTHTKLNEEFPELEMRLGSTIGTNALLERKGARTLLLVTKGFKDLLLIGNQQRPDIFSLNIDKEPPLYTEVMEVNERLSSSGRQIIPLTDREVRSLFQKVKKMSPESVAVSFMHSYLNPGHENKIASMIDSLNDIYISRSSYIAPVINYLNRTETAIVNAYLAPAIERYLQQVQNKIGSKSLRVMTSAGGLTDFNHFLPKDSLFSGPAGGVVGAAQTGLQAGIQNILSFDMGGTSTDVSRYDGKFNYQYEVKIGGITVVSPSINIETVASGGGSVCRYDGMKFTVGPDSAGSAPGPASYGEGGPFSITDVNLLLGRLDEGSFGIPVHKAYAEDELKKLLDRHTHLSTRKEDILYGFLSIANEKMASAIKKISVDSGYDPKDYTLVSFGGAGGQHACDIAEILDISTILIPKDASLLSAAGMGHAKIERFAVRQILKLLKNIQKKLSGIIKSCSMDAEKALKTEGIAKERIFIREVLIYMRFKGQESSLEIIYDGKDLKNKFRNKYEQIYGHWITNRAIEIESIKVIAEENREIEELSEKLTEIYKPQVNEFKMVFLKGSWKKIPLYKWNLLKPGAVIYGPALLGSPFTTVVINPDWQVHLNQGEQAELKYDKIEYSSAGYNIKNRLHPDAVNLELFTNRFKAIAEEMGALLRRTAFSVNIKERLDYSCALLDHEGELIINAPHIPVHLGGLGLCIRQMVGKLHVQPGDVLITNHPGMGGSHLPDITLAAPVFDEKKKLVAYVANRAHHAEIGGKRPGSMPPDAVNLAEEGKVISPMILMRQGRAYWDKIRSILISHPYPTRSIEENMADLNGALASIQSGLSNLQQICYRFGGEQIRYYMQEIKEYASSRLISCINNLEKDTFQATEFLDDGTRIIVSVRFDHDLLYFDFTGSSDLHPGNLNATPAIIRSAIIYVLRLLIDEDIPLNEGIMHHVEIRLPSGFLNPKFPENPENCPAVVGGNTETSQRIVDTLLKALDMAACSQGTMNNFLFGNQSFSYYETICGGVGATSGKDGADAVHQHMTNTRITDPEILEFRYPVRLEYFNIREGSGGKGLKRGGNGVVRKFRFLESLDITLLTQHRKIAPYGLHGAENGKRGKQILTRKSGGKEILEPVAARKVYPGDCIEILTPGGGGWGK